MPAWTTLYVILFWPMLLAACVAAWRWGGTAERFVAASYATAAIAEMLVRSHNGFARLELGVAGVDICLLIALIVALVRYGRLWLYAATAIQMLVSAAHLAKLLEPDLSRMAYIIMTGAGSYPQLLLLILGIVLHARAAPRPADQSLERKGATLTS